MKVEIIIRGSLDIPEDDLRMFKAMGKDELVNVLLRKGRDVRTDVKAVLENDKKVK